MQKSAVQRMEFEIAFVRRFLDADAGYLQFALVTPPSGGASPAQRTVVCDALCAWCRTRVAEGRAAR